ncbi:CLUMA_CG011343, isoform A [Clunio marinus]|uniref:CLUMA_CG011343, isoform A n=1 Tax=Clunio marinus TaxID=568069 RepID=A0A1J1ICP2_9DIPT|nr:CLUMA_CG011343, isoform A [Clunio marinus]
MAAYPEDSSENLVYRMTINGVDLTAKSFYDIAAIKFDFNEIDAMVKLHILKTREVINLNRLREDLNALRRVLIDSKRMIRAGNPEVAAAFPIYNEDRIELVQLLNNGLNVTYEEPPELPNRNATYVQNRDGTYEVLPEMPDRNATYVQNRDGTFEIPEEVIPLHLDANYAAAGIIGSPNAAQRRLGPRMRSRIPVRVVRPMNIVNNNRLRPRRIRSRIPVRVVRPINRVHDGRFRPRIGPRFPVRNVRPMNRVNAIYRRPRPMIGSRIPQRQMIRVIPQQRTPRTPNIPNPVYVVPDYRSPLRRNGSRVCAAPRARRPRRLFQDGDLNRIRLFDDQPDEVHGHRTPPRRNGSRICAAPRAERPRRLFQDGDHNRIRLFDDQPDTPPRVRSPRRLFQEGALDRVRNRLFDDN